MIEDMNARKLCAGTQRGHIRSCIDEATAARVLLSLGYGCGLRASEIVRLKVKHIDRPTKVDTTTRYAHVATGMISAVESPLDQLANTMSVTPFVKKSTARGRCRQL
jgi:integrase